MQTLIHWLGINGNILAVLVTAGVAVFVACCLKCTNCADRDKDDIFRHHEV
ncbi:MAG: hypothetical protein ABSG10_07060 [Terracidiphilus sp.]